MVNGEFGTHAAMYAAVRHAVTCRQTREFIEGMCDEYELGEDQRFMLIQQVRWVRRCCTLSAVHVIIQCRAVGLVVRVCVHLYNTGGGISSGAILPPSPAACSTTAVHRWMRLRHPTEAEACARVYAGSGSGGAGRAGTRHSARDGSGEGPRRLRAQCSYRGHG